MPSVCRLSPQVGSAYISADLRNHDNLFLDDHRRLMGSRICTVAVVFLLLVSGLGKSKEVKVQNAGNDEIYQIDYRGPETHSLLPPPELSFTDPKPKPWMKRDANKARKMGHG